VLDKYEKLKTRRDSGAGRCPCRHGIAFETQDKAYKGFVFPRMWTSSALCEQAARRLGPLCRQLLEFEVVMNYVSGRRLRFVLKKRLRLHAGTRLRRANQPDDNASKTSPKE